ncbi:hypothetical protein [Vibrio harveyi]|uniref:hypothetical protein n=1 Tax=Vibrio harveyi TaxID=669 RepID=UPI003CF23568
MHNGVEVVNFEAINDELKELVELAVTNFSFILSPGSLSAPKVYTFKEFANVLNKHTASEQAKACSEALKAAYFNAMPESISMDSCFAKGGLTQAQCDGFTSIGFYHWHKENTGEAALSDALLAEDELYFDFMFETLYEEAEKPRDHKDLCARFTFDWERKCTYLTLGDNVGEGFDDYLSLEKTSNSLKADTITAIEALADDNYLKMVIKKHPESYKKLLEAINAADNYVLN